MKNWRQIILLIVLAALAAGAVMLASHPHLQGAADTGRLAIHHTSGPAATQPAPRPSQPPTSTTRAVRVGPVMVTLPASAGTPTLSQQGSQQKLEATDGTSRIDVTASPAGDVYLAGYGELFSDLGTQSPSRMAGAPAMTFTADWGTAQAAIIDRTLILVQAIGPKHAQLLTAIKIAPAA